jgi:hypothetical protein
MSTEEHEKEILSEVQKLEEERIEKAKKLGDFDPFKVITAAKEIQIVYDDLLGILKFGELTAKEKTECNKIEDRDAQSVHMIYLMLKKANPSLTEDNVKDFPVQILKRIDLLLGDRIRSFLQLRTSLTTQKPNY